MVDDEAGVNFGICLYPNRLANVTDRVDTNVWSRDWVGTCCQDWYRHLIKRSGRKLLSRLASSPDKKFGSGVAARGFAEADVSSAN